MQDIYSQSNAGAQGIQISKVLRNTYAMLALTLVVSAIAAGISMAVGIDRITSLIMMGAAFVILWFVLPRTENSSMGILVVFAFTALLGASLGPMLKYYMSVEPALIAQALAGTALVFFALSGYVLVSGKNFSFLGGFVAVGMLVVLGCVLASFLAKLLFNFVIPGFDLAVSAAIVLLMSGYILYQTSSIVHGGETNYLRATVGLYIAIYNLFTSLLHLLGALGGDD